MNTPTLAVLASAVTMLAVSGPVMAEPDARASITITPAAVETLTDGQLSLEALGSADELSPAAFQLPVSALTFTRAGQPKSARLDGGVQIQGAPITLDLTKFRVNLPSQRASVRASSPDARIQAFDVARLKVTKKKVSGVLLIAPGTAALLNEQFETYVFTDGLRFARFEFEL